MVAPFIFHNRLKTSQQQQRLKGIGSEIIRQLNPAAENDPPNCDTKKRIHEVDGTCNNLGNPVLGSANTAFIHLPGAGAECADGISKPRQAQDGSDLPNARQVSFKLFTNEDRLSSIMRHMAMTWGEWLLLQLH